MRSLSEVSRSAPSRAPIRNLSEIRNLSDLEVEEETPDPQSLFGPLVESAQPAPPPPTVEAALPPPDYLPNLAAGNIPKVQFGPQPEVIPAINRNPEFEALLQRFLRPQSLGSPTALPPSPRDVGQVRNLPAAQRLPDVMPEAAQAGALVIPEAQGIDYSNLTLGQKAKAAAKGFLSGATMNTYAPRVEPGLGEYFGGGNILGNVGTGAAIAGASALAAPEVIVGEGVAQVLAMLGLSGAGLLATGNDLKARGMDPTDPAFMPLAAIGAALNSLIPGSAGKTRAVNTVTGAGIGAGTNLAQEYGAAYATGTEPDDFSALALGGGLGLGAGLGGPHKGRVEAAAAARNAAEAAPAAAGAPTAAPIRNLSEVFTDEDVEARVDQQFPTAEPQAGPQESIIEKARRLGFMPFETRGKMQAKEGMLDIPTEGYEVEGALSRDHVIAHELAHGILQKRNYNLHGMPLGAVRENISNWDELVAASQAYRPGLWAHEDPKIGKHARRPEEIIADAVGSVLIGKSDFSILRDLPLTQRDLGLEAQPGRVTIEEPQAPTPEAPAPPPPPPQPERMVTPDNPYTQGGEGGSLKEALYGNNIVMPVTDDVRNQLGLWHHMGGDRKRPWSLKEIRQNFRRIQWRLPGKHEKKQDPFNTLREVANEGSFGLVLDGKHHTEIDDNDIIDAIAGGPPQGMFDDARTRYRPAPEPAIDRGIPQISDEDAKAMEAAETEAIKREAAESPDKVAERNGVLYDEQGRELFNIGQQSIFGGEEETPKGRPKPKAEQVDMFAGERLTPDQGPIKGGTKGLEGLPLQEGADKAAQAEGQTTLLQEGDEYPARGGLSPKEEYEWRELYHNYDNLNDAQKARLTDLNTIKYKAVEKFEKQKRAKEEAGKQQRAKEEAEKAKAKTQDEIDDLFKEDKGTKGQTELLNLSDKERAALRRGARAEQMVIGDEEIPRVQVAKRLRKVTDEVAAGKLDAEAAVKEAAKIADEVSTASLARRFKKDIAPRQRGYDIVREKILAARRRGEIDHHQGEMALWFMEKNPDLVEDLGISVRGPGKRSGTAGSYNAAEQVMTLIKGHDNPDTATHEILHHTERMMPEKVRAGILKEWAKDLAREYSGASFKKLKALHEISETNAGRGTHADLLSKFHSGEIPHELYKYFDTSEYWAVNGARILSNRYAASESWIAQARQWFKEFVQKARGLVGLKSDAPILRALDAIRKSEGTRQTDRMLHQEQGRKRRPVIENVADQEPPKQGPKDQEPPAAKEPPKEPHKGPPKPPEKPQQEIFQKGFDLAPENAWNAWLRRVQDKMRPIKRVQRAIEATGKKISEPTNTYLADTNFHGRVGDALVQAEKNYTEKIGDMIRDAGFTRDQVDDYLLARHAEEANEHIRRINPDAKRHFGMSNDDAEAILKKVEADGTKEKLEAIGKKVDEAVNYGLDYALKEGIISEEQAANWRSSYKHYVPSKGFAEADVDDPKQVGAARLGQGYDIRGKEEQMRKGRLGRPDSPLSSAMAQLSTRIIRAEKNRVGKSFLKMVVDNPNKDLWEVNKLTPQQRFDGSVVKQGFTLTKDHPNVVSVKVKGQEYYVYVKDARLAGAMKNQGEEKVNKLMQGMGKINRYLAAVSTTYNPVFGVLNFMRDFQTAGINMYADHGAKFAGKVYKDVINLRAMRGVLSGQKDRKTLLHEKSVDEWAGWYKRFAAAGGKTEYLNFNTVEDLKKRFDSKLNPSALGKGMAPFKWLGEQVSDINGAIENAIRLSAFKHGIEDLKMSEAEAAAYAKTLTVDFNRKGEIGSFMNAAYLFFNANTQGIHRILSVMAKPNTPAGKRMWKAAGTLAAGSAALALFSRANAGEDEDGINRYDKLPPFVKERNLIIWMPGEDAPYTIPVPYGYNLLNVMGQTGIDLWKSTRDTDEIASNAMMAIFSAFNPLGTESSSKPASKGLLKLLSPTQLDPLAQLAVNEDFTGKPIMPEQLPLGTPKPESELHFKSVSPMAKAAAKKLNELGGGNEFVSGEVDVGPFKVGTDVSPEAMEHMVTAFTGGLGKLMYQSADYAKNTAQGKETDVSKTPLIRSFKQGKNEYFDQREFVDKSARYLQFAEAADKMADEELEAFEAKHAEAIDLGYHARDVKKEIETLSKEAREIRTDQDLTEDQKEAELAEIEEEKTKLRREWNGARVKLVNKKKEELAPAAP